MSKRITASLLAMGLFGGILASSARADDDAKIQAMLGQFGKVCKNQVATTYRGISMADITVTVAATFQQSIDSGEITLKDIQKKGASFNWEVPSRKANGDCWINGKGKLSEFNVQ